MDPKERQAHWENVYRTKAETEVSWFQKTPTLSLDFVHSAGVGKDAAIIDIGGGKSRLVDALLDEGYTALFVLDISQKAVAETKARLGQRASHVTWIVGDVTAWEPERTYDLWHDRAVFGGETLLPAMTKRSRLIYLASMPRSAATLRSSSTITPLLQRSGVNPKSSSPVRHQNLFIVCRSQPKAKQNPACKPGSCRWDSQEHQNGC
jgi:hypothetical protein